MLELCFRNLLNTLMNNCSLYRFSQVDIVNDAEITKKYNIQIVPTALIFRNGVNVGSRPGFQYDVQSFVSKYINLTDKTNEQDDKLTDETDDQDDKDDKLTDETNVQDEPNPETEDENEGQSEAQ